MAPPFTKSHRTGIWFLKSIYPLGACVIKATQRRRSINLPNISLQRFLNSSWAYIYKHFPDKNSPHFVQNVREFLDSQKQSVGLQRGLRTAARVRHWQTGDSTPLFSGGNIFYLFFIYIYVCFKVFFLRMTLLDHFDLWLPGSPALPWPLSVGGRAGVSSAILPPSTGSWRRHRACLITL